MGKSEFSKLFTAFASRAYLALYKIQQTLGPKLVGLTTTREATDRPVAASGYNRSDMAADKEDEKLPEIVNPTSA